MLNANLVLTDTATASHTFNLISQMGKETLRTDIGENLDTPALLAVKHSTSGKGVGLVERHLVQFQRTVGETDTGPLVINITMAVPKGSSATAQDVIDGFFQLITLLGGADVPPAEFDWANLEAVLRGES